MPFFETTRFQGSLSGHGSNVPVGFDVTVDDLGFLELLLDPLPTEAYALLSHGRVGTPVDLLTLEGESAGGHQFHSDSFHIAQFSQESSAGEELSIQGECYDAELELPPHEPPRTEPDARVWLVRQFRTFRRIAHETPLGRVVIGGPRQDRDAQDPNGFIAIFRPEEGSGGDWWEASEAFLTHVARVLSFACDTYLSPVIEERYHVGGTTVRLSRQSRASAPFMAPFHELSMQPIFACACDSYFTRQAQIEELDAAIRWLTAPVAYDESRLINAMSALENIINRCGLDEVGNYLGTSAFRRVARRVRALLAELEVPEGMVNKVPELNRRSLAEKVMVLLQARSIALSDMPENWLSSVVNHRNTIVHTGVSRDFGEDEPDAFDHTIWVREIVTRIILERLGFEGAFRSWLHQDEQLRFPQCIPMQQWVAEQDARATQV